jgi:hypothetical protein
MEGMVIAVDFDGTCVTHEYPSVGRDIGAAPVLLELVREGHRLILYTMRDGNRLKDAVNWFNWNKIPLYGVNSNPEQKSWTTSPKVQADFYIDDAAVGCPLKLEDGIVRPYVDWAKMREILVAYALLE